MKKDDPLDDPAPAIAPASVPTTALPGTPAKMEVLSRRVECGESLWHRLDADGSADPPTWLRRFDVDIGAETHQ